jgi:ABC-2 type transport system ATP-binding protein
MIHFDPVLVVTELTKVYRGKPPVTAVDRLSFSLGRGEILGLLGPNGAGKTTTIQMLLSALEPTSGRIAYFGESLKSARALILGQVGFASAYSRLPARLTVAENLDVFGRLYGLPAGQRKARIQELLSKFGVWDLRKRTTERLSSGQVTRVMLAKAFLARPRVVLLDEPTASLDPDIAVLVRTFVRSQRDLEGVSIVFTSHNMDEVAQLCDRVIFLDRGRIAACGRPDELAASVASARLRLRVAHGLDQVEGHARARGLASRVDDETIDVEIDEQDIPDFFAGLVNAGVRYLEVSLQKPTLEDYFLKLAGAAAQSDAQARATTGFREQDEAQSSCAAESAIPAGIAHNGQGEETP